MEKAFKQLYISDMKVVQGNKNNEEKRARKIKVDRSSENGGKISKIFSTQAVICPSTGTDSTCSF